MTFEFDGVEVSTGPAPQHHTVIWLHGLGADGNDFVPVVAELEKLGVTSCRFVFPHAPERPVTINGGMKMRAWYDITSLNFDDRKQDTEGTKQSTKLVQGLIERENARGINTENIVLAGFSQGGAIALHAGLRHEKKLAGIVALSTYLPLADTVADERTATNQSIPVFMAHGVQDDVIAIRYAEAGKKILSDLGYDVQWSTYEMPHSVAMEEIIDLAKWLTLRLAE